MKANSERPREPRACAPAAGPLRILDGNPIYFTADGETPLVLAGVHTWANLQDFAGEVFCFDRYLDLLAANDLNFIRMWTWPGPINCGMTGLDPYPWCRGADGKFDLTRLNPDFLTCLRDRVTQAGERGVYVSVMLFQWHCDWDLYPFNPNNNVNSQTAGLTSMADCLSLADPDAVALEEEYVRGFVAALNDLDNVVWEIGNEIPAEGLAWEGHFVGFVRSCESKMPQQHLIGVNTGTSGNPPDASLDQLVATGADFVSLPSPSSTSYQPPPACGLPILADTDHINYPLNTELAAVKIDWAWRSLTRGLHPMDMEALQIPLPDYTEPWNDLDNPAFPAAQQVTGTILRLSRQLPLATMTPQPDGYVLVNAPDGEPFFVAYQPNGGQPLVLDLSAASGTLWYQFLEPLTGTATGKPQPVAGGDPAQSFGPPNPPVGGGGAWVLVLSDRNPPIQPISPAAPPRS